MALVRRAFLCLGIIAIAWAPMHFLVPEPGIVSCYDLRRTKSGHEYNVVVNSRKSDLFGHAFVTWLYNDPGKQIPDYQSIGFYAGNGVANVEAVRGGTGSPLNEQDVFKEYEKDGGKTPDTQTAVVFWLDQDQFVRSEAALNKWTAGHSYSIGWSDCVTFGSDVLAGFGLRIPPRIFALTPLAFIRAVMEMNPDGSAKCI